MGNKILFKTGDTWTFTVPETLAGKTVNYNCGVHGNSMKASFMVGGTAQGPTTVGTESTNEKPTYTKAESMDMFCMNFKTTCSAMEWAGCKADLMGMEWGDVNTYLGDSVSCRCAIPRCHTTLPYCHTTCVLGMLRCHPLSSVNSGPHAYLACCDVTLLAL